MNLIKSLFLFLITFEVISIAYASDCEILKPIFIKWLGSGRWNDDCCSSDMFPYVFCYGSDTQITELDFTRKNIKTTITESDARALTSLKKLKSIWLNFNDISGEIPKTLYSKVDVCVTGTFVTNAESVPPPFACGNNMIRTDPGGSNSNTNTDKLNTTVDNTPSNTNTPSVGTDNNKIVTPSVGTDNNKITPSVGTDNNKITPSVGTDSNKIETSNANTNTPSSVEANNNKTEEKNEITTEKEEENVEENEEEEGGGFFSKIFKTVKSIVLTIVLVTIVLASVFLVYLKKRTNDSPGETDINDQSSTNSSNFAQENTPPRPYEEALTILYINSSTNNNNNGDSSMENSSNQRINEPSSPYPTVSSEKPALNMPTPQSSVSPELNMPESYSSNQPPPPAYTDAMNPPYNPPVQTPYSYPDPSNPYPQNPAYLQNPAFPPNPNPAYPQYPPNSAYPPYPQNPIYPPNPAYPSYPQSPAYPPNPTYPQDQAYPAYSSPTNN